MMPRAVLRFVSWLITPDRDEGSPQQPIFEMECTTCATPDAPGSADARSPASEDFADVQMWALQHSGRHPAHTSYREIVTRFWRTHMQD